MLMHTYFSRGCCIPNMNIFLYIVTEIWPVTDGQTDANDHDTPQALNDREIKIILAEHVVSGSTVIDNRPLLFP